MSYCTDHAKIRAQERYGVEISPVELEDIYFSCRTGKAFLAKATDRVLVFLMRFRGISIVPMLDVNRTRIITFLPGDFFVKGRQMEYYKAKGVSKQRAANGPDLKRPYRREKITVRQALEE